MFRSLIIWVTLNGINKSFQTHHYSVSVCVLKITKICVIICHRKCVLFHTFPDTRIYFTFCEHTRSDCDAVDPHVPWRSFRLFTFTHQNQFSRAQETDCKLEGKRVTQASGLAALFSNSDRFPTRQESNLHHVNQYPSNNPALQLYTEWARLKTRSRRRKWSRKLTKIKCVVFSSKSSGTSAEGATPKCVKKKSLWTF